MQRRRLEIGIAQHRALQLGEAISAETVKTTERFSETYPAATTVKLVVRSAKQQKPVTIYWYDGKTRPADEVCPEAIATWKSIGVGSTLIVGGVVRGLITLVELAPFFLLAELARLLLSGAAPGQHTQSNRHQVGRPFLATEEIPPRQPAVKQRIKPPRQSRRS